MRLNLGERLDVCFGAHWAAVEDLGSNVAPLVARRFGSSSFWLEIRFPFLLYCYNFLKITTWPICWTSL